VYVAILKCALVAAVVAVLLVPLELVTLALATIRRARAALGAR
jgi:hypothetical protein